MQDIKKAVPVLEHQDGKVETGPTFQSGPHSYAQSTTIQLPGQSVHIADFLSHGQQNAVPLKQLKELLHQDGRTVRLMIRAERLSGTPILESSKATGGYYLPSTPDERARCVQSMRHRTAEIVRVADAIEEAGI